MIFPGDGFIACPEGEGKKVIDFYGLIFYFSLEFAGRSSSLKTSALHTI
jgi:hypothetical protein